MAMLVGDRDRFAIEYEWDPLHGDEPESADWGFGRMRWWCGGEPVGRYDLGTPIGEVAAAIGRVVALGERRHSADLMARPAPEVVWLVAEALFAADERSEQQIAADGAHYWPFFVGPRTESFDPWDVFVIEGEHAARLIWCRVGRPDVRECALRRGEFDVVLRMFLDEWKTERP
jgi:hypothetical protein